MPHPTTVNTPNLSLADAAWIFSTIIFRLQRRLNSALQQAGIYTMNMTIFGVDEAVDSAG